MKNYNVRLVGYASLCIFLYILSISVFIYFNNKYTRDVSGNTEEFLTKLYDIDRNLRGSVFKLQNDIIFLPKIFTDNRREIIIKNVIDNFPVEEKVKIFGWDSYAQFFSRTEKRDLGSGIAIANVYGDKLYFSYGVLDENGDFSNAIERIRLRSNNPESDLARLQNIISTAYSSPNTSSNFEEKIATLKKITTDTVFASEKTRIEYLGNEKDITLAAKNLAEANKEKRQQRLQLGLVVITCNMLLLVLLTCIMRNKSSQRTPEKCAYEANPAA